MNTPTLMRSEEERAPWNDSIEDSYPEDENENEDEEVCDE